MSRNYKIRDQEKLYFASFAIVYWIDVFVRAEYGEVVVDSLDYIRRHKEMEIDFGASICTRDTRALAGSWMYWKALRKSRPATYKMHCRLRIPM